MSNVPAVQDQAPALPADMAAVEAMFMARVRRTKALAPTFARMPGLNSSLLVKKGSGSAATIDYEATAANVEVVGISLNTYGIDLNAINVQQFDCINGTMTPRCQLQMGVVTELTGHAISLPVSTMDRAVAVLVRADNGERHEAEYTTEMAEASGALDFWVERWADRQGGGRYLAEKVVLGRNESEALAAQRSHAVEWIRKAPLKSLEAWHKYRPDMMGRRALKRVMRWGAPEVMSGVVSLRRHYPNATVAKLASQATVSVDMALEDDDQDIAALGERPALPPAAGPVYREAPAPVQVVRGYAARVLRLHRQVNALPEDWQRPLSLAWGAKGIPSPESDDFMPHHLDEAETIVDQITAEALRRDGDGGSGPSVGTDGAPPVSTTVAPGGHGAAGDPQTASAQAVETPTRPEPARPLAQQIAMQAEKAGVDRAAVIFAVTCGAKTSAKDVDPEEGQLVLEAIAAISRGEYDLVEKSPGVWSFGDRRQPAQASLDDMGRPFE